MIAVGLGEKRMPAKIFLLAAEPAADALGARLMQALRDQTMRSLEFAGVGGARMARGGLISLFPMADLAAPGVVPHGARVWRRLRQAVASIERFRTDLVLSIGGSGSALPRQRRLSGRALMRVHYAAPQSWSSRPARAARLARDIDHLLALLPFEPAFFRRHGVPCSFVGHPIVEEMAEAGDGAHFRRRYELPADAPILCLLPGSRQDEVTRHLPLLEQAVTAIWQRVAPLRPVLPTEPGMASLVKRSVARWKLPVLVVEDRSDRFDAYAASWLAISTSSTGSLEAALAGLPTITTYRPGALTAWLGRRLIPGPHVNPVNLILGRPVVPELLEGECRPERIAAAALRLIGDQRLRSDQQAALAEVAVRLRGTEGRLPSQCAAARVLELLADHQQMRRTP
jgi:lipid-A-disaccharide synthase